MKYFIITGFSHCCTYWHIDRYNSRCIMFLPSGGRSVTEGGVTFVSTGLYLFVFDRKSDWGSAKFASDSLVKVWDILKKSWFSYPVRKYLWFMPKSAIRRIQADTGEYMVPTFVNNSLKLSENSVEQNNSASKRGFDIYGYFSDSEMNSLSCKKKWYILFDMILFWYLGYYSVCTLL